MKIRSKFIFNRLSCLIIGIALVGVSDLCAKSLWLHAIKHERGMFADKVAAGVGDILTIVVSESTTMKNKMDLKEANKESTILNTISQYLFTKAASDFGTHNGELPKTSFTGKTEFKGKGDVANESTLTATLSVTIIDTLPNGNLVFEGAREIAYSDEREFAVLHGTVRPEDIETDNTILSTKIADARIEFISEGSLTAAQRKGWLLKFHDFINPL